MDGSLKENGKSWFYNNLANFITSVRLICTFCIMIIGAYYPEMIMAMFILVILASVSDLLDGKIARRNGTTSEFGGFLDRVADKLFICSIVVIIVWRYWPVGNIHFLKIITEGIVGSVIFLEIILIFTSVVGFFYGVSVSSNKWGKLKMVLQTTAVILWFFLLVLSEYIAVNLHLAIITVDICLVLAVFFAVKSISGYYEKFMLKLKK